MSEGPGRGLQGWEAWRGRGWWEKSGAAGGRAGAAPHLRHGPGTAPGPAGLGRGRGARGEWRGCRRAAEPRALTSSPLAPSSYSHALDGMYRVFREGEAVPAVWVSLLRCPSRCRVRAYLGVPSAGAGSGARGVQGSAASVISASSGWGRGWAKSGRAWQPAHAWWEGVTCWKVQQKSMGRWSRWNRG